MIKLKYLLVLSLILFIVCGCSSEASQTTETISKQTYENPWEVPFEERDPKYYLVGETAIYDNYQVLIEPVAKLSAYTTSSGLVITPKQGNLFVLTVVGITNNTDDDITISTERVEAYADNLLVPTSDYTYSINNSFTMLDTLAPGKTAAGAILYEVPDNFKELELDYKTDYFDNKRIVFKLYSDQLPLDTVVSPNTEN